MNNPVAIIINSHSSSQDMWPMFFGQFTKHVSPKLFNGKVYVFCDKRTDAIPADYTVITYNSEVDFRTQYLSCLKQVSEPICLTMNDDYVLYDTVKDDVLNGLVNVLSNSEQLAQVRLMRGPNFLEEEKFGEDLYWLDNKREFFYSQTTSLWKKDTLQMIHELSPPSGIGRKKDGELQLEVAANFICRKKDLKGVCYYNGEPKRGMYHYDSSVIPHVASALVGGKWNMREYAKELSSLFKQYRINPEVRGVY